MWGGGASCFNLDAPDYYGKFSSSWEPSGGNSKQLKHWLDPNDSGIGAIDGLYIGEDLAIDEVSPTIDFKLYPNPNNGKFNVQLNIATIKGYSLIVTDLMGRIFYTSKLTSNDTHVNLEDASNGTYLMTVIGNNVNLTKTLIIKE